MRRRFSCGNWGERFLEGHFEFDGRLTRRLSHRLVADAQVMTIRAVARRHGGSWPVMNTLVRAWSGFIAEHRRSPHPRLKAGWQVLQQLHGLYSAADHQGALEVLDRFCDLYETGDLPEFHDIDDTIIAWSNEILAWAPHQPPQQRQNRRHP